MHFTFKNSSRKLVYNFYTNLQTTGSSWSRLFTSS